MRTLIFAALAAFALTPALAAAPARAAESVPAPPAVSAANAKVRQVFEAAGLIGTWGVDCNAQASSTEWESITIHAGAVKKPGQGCGLSLYLEAPPDSPLPEPRERKPRLQAHFSGMALRGIERHSGGVRIRALVPPPPEGEEPKPLAIPLLPARTWPQGTEPGESEPIPWCP